MNNWTFMQWIVAIIIVAAAVGILLVVIPVLGFSIPGWVIQIAWILLVAVIAVGAIRFLMYLWGSWGNK
jgi:hypothetical protein